MSNRLNKYKYPGAKRLMLEAQELKDNTEDYCAQPIDDNLFEWHFTVRGPPDTAFDGGFYHGRLSFPTEYPMKPPSIILLTPNGRFETNKKICLSISGYHPETWQPSWSVRTALLALIAFMPTKTNRAIGSLDFSDAERKKLAIKSRTWSCETCGLIKNLLVQPDNAIRVNLDEKDQCVPGTSSRVSGENSPDIGKEESQKKEHNDTDRGEIGTMGSASLEGEFENKHSVEVNHQSNLNTNEPRLRLTTTSNQSRPGNESPGLQYSYRNSTTNSNNIQNNLTDRRRSYHPSPLMLKSIFVILSLLILRRVVMVIQS